MTKKLTITLLEGDFKATPEKLYKYPDKYAYKLTVIKPRKRKLPGLWIMLSTKKTYTFKFKQITEK